ncbi:DUF7111 family protein [Halanaeroarchaeum sulfurireducens]|uniref:Uncharacterized protein n=1 Tax=Halanaeroarchaeum sulfurireducens TaxID=1604004 RepID=A0A0F7PBI4_9EURY|nr:hypothetical protein [Halanaeroarchaeum sulfurireducens]AKH97520.1 hypothetical protein HLASF_1031 [Halanaeroarchaeum sulfurireducens]ALG81916.1 hypothetical protein HLASA_1020 [Halanaeroarchaeum sulfurireducens]
MNDTTTAGNSVESTYFETETERVIKFVRGDTVAVVALNNAGYGMLKVRSALDGEELERYYGLDMALDHAGDLLDHPPNDLPVPDEATDMGM